MRILVTGADGFLGGHLLLHLLEEGYETVGLRRDHPAVTAAGLLEVASRVTWTDGDVTDTDLIERILADYSIEAVFHLAAQAIVGTAKKVPYDTFRTNLMGTVSVLDATRRYGECRAVIVASSDKAYGEADRLPYTEDTPLNGLNIYDSSKACADIAARSYARAYKLPVAVTRCANLYGEADPNRSRLVPEICLAIAEGRRPVLRSDGSLVRDYIYVRDAVRGYMAVLDLILAGKAGGRAFNIGTGIPTSVLDLVRKAIEASGADLEPEIMGEVPPPDEIREQTLDSAELADLTGWSPGVTLDEGLRRVILWYRENLDRFR